MAVRPNAQTIQEQELVVAFFDLTGFLRFSRVHTAMEVFSWLDQYYEFVGEWVSQAEGRVVKFMGDAGLLVYPGEAADGAVVNLVHLKAMGDRWLAEHEAPCRQIIKAHVGSVICGPLGTRREKRFDVISETVNTSAILPSHGLAITPALFRKLTASTRKLFKKHTPPVRYIPVEESHQDERGVERSVLATT